ncbi:hypothetical protein BST88_25025, partial [Salmonella enterica subsp. enterica serovar Typhi]
NLSADPVIFSVGKPKDAAEALGRAPGSHKNRAEANLSADPVIFSVGKPKDAAEALGRAPGSHKNRA